MTSLFDKQLEVFPQEKIYLHTDKPYYISSERIWFRAYVADAKSHEPVPVSRYVYVELINPLDMVVARVKIRQEEGAYHGYLPIPNDAPEGDYTIRAYTTFMRSLDEHYFYTKAVRIGDPQARTVCTETQFAFESDRRVHASFRFSHAILSVPLVPKSLKISVNEGKPMNIKMDKDGSASVQFNLPATSRKRILLLEVIASQNPYRQFIQVPTPDDDFDVSFYPEGGSLMQGTFSKIAFKSMKSNGQSADISGTIYDKAGTEIRTFKSDYLGMGSFPLLTEKGKTYYVICQNDKGQSKRFDLPAAVEHGYSLSVTMMKDKLYVTVLKPAEAMQSDDIYLLAHTRGSVHFVNRWNHEKNLIIQQEPFPSGVLHLILFDAGLNPVSERLVFINNPDQAQVSYKPDKDNYATRSLVKTRITVTGSKGHPITGSFSVAVTSDKEVQADSISNILTQLLLTSDLRGTIENPAYYFQNTTASALALDLLMCTQGWRRYNIAELAQGRFSRPASPLEMASEISGTVQSVVLGKPVKNIEVTMMSLQHDFLEKTKTDKDGRFYLRGIEWPDSTRFIMSAVPRKGLIIMELIPDRESFPERTLLAVPPAGIDRYQFAQYADKAEQQYVYENGVRMINLPEVNISAERKPLRKSMYYDPSFPHHIITAEEIRKSGATNIALILNQLPGVYAKGEGAFVSKISIRNSLREPLIIVDDVIGGDYGDITNIDQIDVLKGANPFGMQGSDGVIVIHTKRGKIITDESKPLHIKELLPLGYQQSVEFYAPKYDTPEKRNEQTPDLRTTIHWQPGVQTNEQGEASFEFYTADESTSYTVVIEGLADDGSIIRQEGKIEVE